MNRLQQQKQKKNKQQVDINIKSALKFQNQEIENQAQKYLENLKMLSDYSEQATLKKQQNFMKEEKQQVLENSQKIQVQTHQPKKKMQPQPNYSSHNNIQTSSQYSQQQQQKQQFQKKQQPQQNYQFIYQPQFNGNRNKFNETFNNNIKKPKQEKNFNNFQIITNINGDLLQKLPKNGNIIKAEQNNYFFITKQNEINEKRISNSAQKKQRNINNSFGSEQKQRSLSSAQSNNRKQNNSFELHNMEKLQTFNKNADMRGFAIKTEPDEVNISQLVLENQKQLFNSNISNVNKIKNPEHRRLNSATPNVSRQNQSKLQQDNRNHSQTPIAQRQNNLNQFKNQKQKKYDLANMFPIIFNELDKEDQDLQQKLQLYKQQLLNNQSQQQHAQQVISTQAKNYLKLLQQKQDQQQVNQQQQQQQQFYNNGGNNFLNQKMWLQSYVKQNQDKQKQQQ